MIDLKNSLRCLASILILLILFSVGTAQEFKVSNIEINQVRWGFRKLIVRVENHRADSVRMEIVIYTLYQDHHLSGLDRAMFDTSYVVGPGRAGGYKLDFEIPGSYHKRLVSRAFVYWEYLDLLTDQTVRDSTFKSFNNVFFPSDDAFAYANNKYLVGPIGCIDNYDLLAFDYPRIMLYLLGRGETIKEISRQFVVQPQYSKYLADKAERIELAIPISESGLYKTDFISISEREGYDIRLTAKSAVDLFRQWYEKEGEKELTKVLKKSGIDGPALSMPSVRMQVMLAWLESAVGYSQDHMLFNSFEEDTVFRQKPLWIFQGGEFFAPKLSLMNFVQSDQLYIGTFRYAPVQKYEKSPINDLKRIVDDYTDSIVVVRASSMRRATLEIGHLKSFIKIGKEMSEWIEKNIGLTKGIDNENLHYLADYYYRYILGELFGEMQKEMPYDCVRVEYEK